MGYDQQRAFKLIHGGFDPFAGIQIQVVGRLVQNQHVDGAVHQHAQLQPRALAARKLGYQLELIFAAEAVRAQAVARLLRFAPQIIQQGVVQRALGMLKGNLLGQVGCAHRRAELHHARIRAFLAQKNFEQRGFACAVCAHQRHALAAAADGFGDALKQRAFAIGFFQILDAQRVIGAEGYGGKAQLQPLLAGGLFGLPQPFDALLDGKHALVGFVHAAVRPGAHLFGGLFKLRNLGLLFFVLL